MTALVAVIHGLLAMAVPHQRQKRPVDGRDSAFGRPGHDVLFFVRADDDPEPDSRAGRSRRVHHDGCAWFLGTI
jgi:hypothetical protein